jgi:acyl-CoA synthetase (AMP-forming)/AMP-acid ligase II
MMAVLQKPDQTILDRLRRHAQTHPDRLAYRFLRDNDASDTLTFGQLDRRLRVLAACLRQHAAAGDRALLLYPPGLEFIEAFLGCLAAGVIAVPAYPPRRNRKAERLQTIAEDAQPRLILTTCPLRPGIEASELGAANGLPILATDALEGETGDTGSLPEATADTVAFLQYTSGSTGMPRGVVVSHGSLMANERAIQAAFGHTQDSIGVNWLPAFHDMGLIGTILQSLFLGCCSVLLAPNAFLLEPVRWLRAITEYQATTAGAPNFAYDHCVRSITEEQKQGLDLRSWKVAYNGSEPVRPETLDRFAAAFAACGFRPEMFYPCYGLAEATLFVSGGLPARRPTIRTVSASALEQGWAEDTPPNTADARALVSCGRPWQGQKILIVDPDAQTRCPEGRVGEIWVAGPSVAAGYWNRSEENERTFRAFLTDPAEGPFLRSGDLGFVRDGELFVTGRLKDVLIIRGRNHYPQDLEATVQSVHPALPAGGGAAFEIEADGEARLIVVQEVVRGFRGDVAELLDGIRHAIAEQHGLQVHDLVFLEPGSLPKTSSGKVQRHACRAAYQRGTLRRWKGT